MQATMFKAPASFLNCGPFLDQIPITDTLSSFFVPFCFSETPHVTDSVSVRPTALQSFQKEITLNTERIDGLIVFGEGLIQKSSLQDAALIEEELEELHSYCQEVFSRLVRFHQRLSQPPVSWNTHTHTHTHTHINYIHSYNYNSIYAFYSFF